MRIWKGNLRNKIITWSFVPTAIILVTVALVSLYTYQKVTENLVIERDRELTRLSARLLATELASYTDQRTEKFLAIFDGVILFDSAGEILAAEPIQYETRKPSWFRDIPLAEILDSSEPVFSDIIVDRLHGEKIVVVVVPLATQRDDNPNGIAGLFRLDSTANSALFKTIEKLRRGESNCIYLVDSNGDVIYHTDSEYIGADFSAHAVVEMVLMGWAGTYRTHNFQGQEIVASFAPVPGTPWGLVIEESWAALTQSSRRYGQLLFLLLALGIVLPIGIVSVGVQRITQPIADLITAAQEIASGHFGRRIQASSGDELENLAEQFNLMAAQLQESYASLEQKVEDRTKELASLNAIAAEVSQSLELAEILENALDEVIEVMGMEAGQAFRLEEDSQTLISMAHRGLSEQFLRHTTRLPLEVCLAGQAAQVGRPVIRSADDSPREDLKELIKEENLQIVISIPLMVHGRCVGAVNLGTHTPRAITEEELALLAAIGHQIGVAVENARLYEQAQQLAVIKERNRLARDLHDSVTQALYGVTLYAEAATRRLQLGDTDLASGHLSEIRETAQESLREMRLLIFELRLPMLKQEGLAAALQARLDAVEGRVGMATDLIVEGEGQIPVEMEEGLYRIAQEALNNTLRHACAGSVWVRLHLNESVTLEIEDDGIGFDPAEAQEHTGFGLRGMEERAVRLGGKFTLSSSPGKGTRIRVEVRR